MYIRTTLIRLIGGWPSLFRVGILWPSLQQ